MSSIVTNASAMTALKTLNATSKALQTTQAHISTGFRIAEASDNAAYWSIATTMRSDNKALSAVNDALGLGTATVDTAYLGMSTAIEVVDEIKAKLIGTREPGVDRAKIQSELDQLQTQLRSIAATFSGENWLQVDNSVSNYNAVKSIVSSFTRDSNGAISVGTLSIDTTRTLLLVTDKSGILDNETILANSGNTFSVVAIHVDGLTNSDADLQDLDQMIGWVDGAIRGMTSAASYLGSFKKRIDIQKTFVANLMGTIDRGVGTLVDADMNEESTRLQALQVQQQLGIQALSIANGNSQSILSLFR